MQHWINTEHKNPKKVGEKVEWVRLKRERDERLNWKVFGSAGSSVRYYSTRGARERERESNECGWENSFARRKEQKNESNASRMQEKFFRK